MSRLGTGAGRVGVLFPRTSPRAQAQVLVHFCSALHWFLMGGNLGRQHPGWGSSCAVGLWCLDTPGTHLGARGRGCCRGRGQGPGQSVCGMVWVWFPPGSEGGVCFSLFPLEAVLLLDVGCALSGSVFCWGTVCPDTDKPVQSGCGTVEREVGLGGCWPRGWPRKHQTTGLLPVGPGSCSPPPGAASPRPLCCPHGSMGASCTLRGTSESPSVTKPPELVLGRRACGVPAPAPPCRGRAGDRAAVIRRRQQ